METQEIVGRNAVLEHLRTLKPPRTAELYLVKTAHGKIIETILNEARSRGIRVVFCERSFLAGVEPSSQHQGVMLRVAGGEPEEDEGEFLRKVRDKMGALVVLDQLSDPRNIGSIIRSAEALGADCVVLPRSHSSGITPTVTKASAGATAHVRILTVPNISQFLDTVKSMGFWTIGASEDGEKVPEDVAGYSPAALVIGSEGSGMRRLTREKCDFVVRIPLRGNISSLNASVAAGILLYELLKKKS